jgi:hypothetical protein
MAMDSASAGSAGFADLQFLARSLHQAKPGLDAASQGLITCVLTSMPITLKPCMAKVLAVGKPIYPRPNTHILLNLTVSPHRHKMESYRIMPQIAFNAKPSRINKAWEAWATGAPALRQPSRPYA